MVSEGTDNISAFNKYKLDQLTNPRYKTPATEDTDTWQQRAIEVFHRIDRDAFEPDKWRGDIHALLAEVQDAIAQLIDDEERKA